MAKKSMTNEEYALLELLEFQINKGIVVDGEQVRDFGIVDFYYLFQTHPTNILKNYGIYMDESAKQKLKSLIDEYPLSPKHPDIKKSYSARYFIKNEIKYVDLNHKVYKTNEYGKKVLDMEHSKIITTTEEDRKAAYGYMDTYQLPKTPKIFSVVLRTYMSETLPTQLEQQHVRVKKMN